MIGLQLDSQFRELLGLVESRAQNLFMTRQLNCAEAVFLVLNKGFGGGLPETTAIRLASAITDGLGGAGCLCGALGGGVLALGLFLGRNRAGGKDRYHARQASRALHDLFRDHLGSTCRRVLNKKTKENSRSHFEHCKEVTGIGARLAAQVILERRPELSKNADLKYLEHLDSKIGANLKRVVNLFQK
jgi:C_GCAxxG_C_C family probable redox protein